MYPLTGQTGKGVFLVKYNYKFKKECVQKYKKGEYPKTPIGWLSQVQYKLRLSAA